MMANPLVVKYEQQNLEKLIQFIAMSGVNYVSPEWLNDFWKTR